MIRTFSWLKPGHVGIVPLALAAGIAWAQQPPEPQTKQRETRVIRVVDGAGGEGELTIDLVGDAAALDGEHQLDVLVQVPTSDYWLGIQIQPLDEALRTQLNLPAGDGILAAKVLPDGPAAKAGLQDNDVLLAAGEKPLKELGDLVRAVDEAKEQPLALKVLRGGNTVVVSVTATKRPEQFRPSAGPERVPLPGGKFGALKLFAGGEPFNVKLPDHWIGVECYPAADALRAQLQLPEGQGLVVGDVTADSPAAKAGLAVHDILLSVGEKPLKQPSDLADAVAAAQDKPLALKGLRGGKPLEIAVTPEKRPDKDVVFWRDGAGGALRVRPDIQGLLKALPGEAREQAYRLHVPMPGFVLPHGAPTDLKLPANLSVTISKKGDQPAQITVERDNEKWSVNEKELDKLPADVRPHVSAMLGRVGAKQIIVQRHVAPGGANEGTFDIEIQEPRTGSARATIVRDRLEAIERQLERLREEIRSLRDRQGDPPKPASGAGLVPAPPQPPVAVPVERRTRI